MKEAMTEIRRGVGGVYVTKERSEWREERRATSRLLHEPVIHQCLISPIERVDGMWGEGYSYLHSPLFTIRTKDGNIIHN